MHNFPLQKFLSKPQKGSSSCKVQDQSLQNTSFFQQKTDKSPQISTKPNSIKLKREQSSVLYESLNKMHSNKVIKSKSGEQPIFQIWKPKLDLSSIISSKPLIEKQMIFKRTDNKENEFSDINESLVYSPNLLEMRKFTQELSYLQNELRLVRKQLQNYQKIDKRLQKIEQLLSIDNQDQSKAQQKSGNKPLQNNLKIDYEKQSTRFLENLNQEFKSQNGTKNQATQEDSKLATLEVSLFSQYQKVLNQETHKEPSGKFTFKRLNKSINENVAQALSQEKKMKIRLNPGIQAQSQNQKSRNHIINHQILSQQVIKKKSFDFSTVGSPSNKTSNCLTQRKVTSTKQSIDQKLQNETISKEEQKQKVKQALCKFEIQKRCSNNLKAYLISSSWYRKWQEYVNYDTLSSTQQSSQEVTNRNPGIINNSQLICKDSGRLKEGLLEHYDFEILNNEAWSFLERIYGSISRPILKGYYYDNKIENNWVLDLGSRFDEVYIQELSKYEKELLETELQEEFQQDNLDIIHF